MSFNKFREFCLRCWQCKTLFTVVRYSRKSLVLGSLKSQN